MTIKSGRRISAVRLINNFPILSGRITPMAIRLFLSITFVACLMTTANAQSGSRNANPVAPRQVVPQQVAPQQFAPQPRAVYPGQNPYYGQGGIVPPGASYNPILGSGLPGAQKPGCNCFDLNFAAQDPYDPYASRNYWNLCPPATQARPRSTCPQPAFNYNYFIPRPTGRRIFGR